MSEANFSLFLESRLENTNPLESLGIFLGGLGAFA